MGSQSASPPPAGRDRPLAMGRDRGGDAPAAGSGFDPASGLPPMLRGRVDAARSHPAAPPLRRAAPRAGPLPAQPRPGPSPAARLAAARRPPARPLAADRLTDARSPALRRADRAGPRRLRRARDRLGGARAGRRRARCPAAATLRRRGRRGSRRGRDQLRREGRKPPRATDDRGVPPLGRATSRFSFPSAHAASSLAGATALGRVAPPARLPLLAVAALVCAGRPYLGMHYPSDVLAGAALGAAIGRLWPLPAERARIDPPPAAAR